MTHLLFPTYRQLRCWSTKDLHCHPIWLYKNFNYQLVHSHDSSTDSQLESWCVVISKKNCGFDEMYKYYDCGFYLMYYNYSVQNLTAINLTLMFLGSNLNNNQKQEYDDCI